MLDSLIKLSRSRKKIIFVLHDIVLLFVSFGLATGLSSDIENILKNTDNLKVICLTIFLSLFLFARMGLYRAMIRYAGEKILKIIAFCSFLSVSMLMATAFYVHTSLPRTVPVFYFLFVLVFMVGSRFTIKGLLRSKCQKSDHPVVIYGAGSAGRQLLASIKRTDEYYPVAFVDDDPELYDTIIDDIKVYQASDLEHVVSRYGVKAILLVIPSITKKQRKEIIRRLEFLPCKVLSIPGLKDLVEGTVSVSKLKKISIIDLLGRETVSPLPKFMGKDIKGKVVMVTGAGGSIGSELCRQIIRQTPNKLLLFELSEFSLYRIEKELSEYVHKEKLSLSIVPILGSVQNYNHLNKVMNFFKVETIYHSAAYKHVPLVEYNTIEGVQNNIFGTLYCAKAAISSRVKTFVLISTDKAVRPTNTMGTTKRLTELLLQALAQQKDHSTRFTIVRFGNVLGSSGSVVPLFEKQIAEGGPITLTHKDITRFFMTIPEAAQLVIQAGAMGQGGDVFLLDMGEPVKIFDLAQQMIRLNGLKVKDKHSPQGDIEIKITGLRPGEKLYEELLIGDNAEGTEHPQIMTTQEKMLGWHELEQLLNALEEACKVFDPQRVRQILLTASADFHPNDDICDILYDDKE
ncbi:MAG: nucleoside-diphosphate sugar epimerase [Desulfobacterales bacterium]|nr:MAG: nucleoside-diphosphate sugar epimerase [Desulfobacterales bacterium]